MRDGPLESADDGAPANLHHVVTENADASRVPTSDRAKLFLQRHRGEIRLTAVGIAVTVLATAMVVLDVGGILVRRVQEGHTGPLIEQILFCAIVGFLVYGNLVYQVARLNHYKRQARHRPAERETIDALYDRAEPQGLTVLIPAYREEPRVVTQTLLSAALLEHPARRVVLLIDDPPDSGDVATRQNVEAMRALPGKIEQWLREPAERLDGAFRRFRKRLDTGALDPRAEATRLARHYRYISRYLQRRAAEWDARDHTDRFFVERILRDPARAHREMADELVRRATHDDRGLTAAEIARHYRRLSALFRVRLTSFERKRYANLSHEPNKAMNLNSYIGLMGRRYRTFCRGDELHLGPCREEGAPDVELPDAAYIITLDADSIVLPDYALRLIHELEKPANADVAVIQTPYSAYPGAPGVLERVAGATTDIQHIIHQGFTSWGATYWVGANALLRRESLSDIGEQAEERGYTICKFISDRTVIEDTESSIDLVRRGWRLVNYPDRLAYSATPPDFGSLLIQRRRWANGGLLILPKLLRYLARHLNRPNALREGFMRIHYLTSLAGVSVGVLALLLYPFEESMRNLWLPLTALPYFFLYGRDLVQVGYRWTDLLRVYSLNLMLIPIHLGGILLSLRQATTGKRTPFGRTPKVANRTAAPPLYHLAIYAVIAYCGIGSLVDLENGRWVHAMFASTNMLFFAYAAVRFMGPRDTFEDLAAACRGFRRQRSICAAEPLTPLLREPPHSSGTGAGPVAVLRTDRWLGNRPAYPASMNRRTNWDSHFIRQRFITNLVTVGNTERNLIVNRPDSLYYRHRPFLRGQTDLERGRTEPRAAEGEARSE